MILPLVADAPTWYGPATATFRVQFAGDPFDVAQNDVRVRFLGAKNEREERVAVFDPDQGTWRATLYTTHGGKYRPILVHNGQDTQVDPQEGIVEALRADDLGVVQAKSPRADRLILDTGKLWVGFGADLGSAATPEKIAALARAGANWVRLVPPADPPGSDPLAAFGAAMDAVSREGLYYSLTLPVDPSPAWRRYALARFGASPRLAQWDAPTPPDDPLNRATVSTATPWPGLFENRSGPFFVRDGDLNRVRALRTVLDTSDWVEWSAPRPWKTDGAKGVAESDRLILVAEPGAKLVGVPLADGTYDLTTVDPATGSSVVGTVKVDRASVALPLPGERFFVLRRRLA